MHKIYFVAVVVLFSLVSFGQEHPQDFHPPLDIPLVLSGTFGELRNNHFHAGIDIKTQGQSGLKVYAIADGYVSRIKVSPWGYGKAIYITHDNGYSSVYAHLMRYTGAIQDYVISNQYKNQSYDIELFPTKDELRVKKGEIIGLSGNTGSSAAPHLHFEIRNSQNQYPQNGLQFGFDITDNIPPVIKELKVYSKAKKTVIDGDNEDKIFLVKGSAKNCYIDKTIEVSGPYALGINTYDLLNKANNKNGVYSIEVLVDSQLIYSHTMKEFGFHETRYINSHLDYSEKVTNKRKLHKCFLEPNNKLSIYDYVANKGIINPKNGTQKVVIRVKDVYENVSELNFNVKKSEQVLSNNNIKDTVKFTSVFPFEEQNSFDNELLSIEIPKYSLYDTLFFTYKVFEDSSDIFHSPIHCIHNEESTVHSPYALSVKTTVPDSLASKSYICKLNKTGKPNYVGGNYKDGKISVKTRLFGNFTVAIDTINPIVKGLNIYPGKTMKSSTLKMTIKDEESGVKTYSATINDEWVLMEYEPKNNKLTHYFKKDLKAGKHVFKLVVYDSVNNATEYQAVFYR
ncbi:MAG: M23 family metallopeptidase [Flavobacteriales bacterium]|nr:M23 family metallopeptidase [Flavobacteriales bacterium]